ncbi:MAG: hypothetical protein AB1758_37960, partial [Candidatus Eremiobacterota bacterium]
AGLADRIASNSDQAAVEVSRLCFQELERETPDPAASATYGLIGDLVGAPLSYDRDRSLLARTFLSTAQYPDYVGLGILAAAAGSAVDQLSDRGVAEFVPALLSGLETKATAWGDLKVVPPLVQKARQDPDSRSAVRQLCEDLTSFCGEDYWLVLAAQGGPQQSQIEERHDAVIVGGVRVPKNGA